MLTDRWCSPLGVEWQKKKLKFSELIFPSLHSVAGWFWCHRCRRYDELNLHFIYISSTTRRAHDDGGKIENTWWGRRTFCCVWHRKIHNLNDLSGSNFAFKLLLSCEYFQTHSCHRHEGVVRARERERSCLSCWGEKVGWVKSGRRNLISVRDGFFFAFLREY